VALGEIDPVTVQPHLGMYANAELGQVTLTMQNGRLLLDAGELSSELRPRANDPATLLLVDPPLSLFSEAYGATVTFGGDHDAEIVITIPGSVTGPAQRFVFDRVEGSGTG
ncbi:MAG: hypothetical protein U0075_26290, partial [Thermomicrobiales bacterium]